MGGPAADPRAGTSVRQTGEDRVTVRVGDRVFEAAAACPHRRGRLVFGHVNAARLRITCPLHHSSYSLETGENVNGPAGAPLQVRELPPCAGGGRAPGTEGPGAGEPGG